MLLLYYIVTTTAVIISASCVNKTAGQCCSATQNQLSQMIQQLSEIEGGGGTGDAYLSTINASLYNTGGGSGATNDLYGTQKTWNSCAGDFGRTTGYATLWSAASLMKAPLSQFSSAFGTCTSGLTQTAGMALYDDYDTIDPAENSTSGPISLTNWAVISSRMQNATSLVISTISSTLTGVYNSLNYGGQSAANYLSSIWGGTGQNVGLGDSSGPCQQYKLYWRLTGFTRSTSCYPYNLLPNTLFSGNPLSTGQQGQSIATWGYVASGTLNASQTILETIAANTASLDSSSSIPAYGQGNFNLTNPPKTTACIYLPVDTSPTPSDSLNFGLFPQYCTSNPIPNHILAVTDVSIGMTANYFAIGFMPNTIACVSPGSCPIGGESYTRQGGCSWTSGSGGATYGTVPGTNGDGITPAQMAWMDITQGISLIGGVYTFGTVDENSFFASVLGQLSCSWPTLHGTSNGTVESARIILSYYPMPYVSGEEGGYWPETSIPGSFWNCAPGDTLLLVNMTDVTFDSKAGNLYKQSVNWLDFTISAAYYPTDSSPENVFYPIFKSVPWQTTYTQTTGADFRTDSTWVSAGGTTNVVPYCISPGAMYAPAKILKLGVQAASATNIDFYHSYSYPAIVNYQQGYLGMSHYDRPGSLLPGWAGTGAQTISYSNSPFNSNTYASLGRDYLFVYVCSKVLKRAVFQARVSSQVSKAHIPTTYYGSGNYVEWLEIYTTNGIDAYNEKIVPGFINQITLAGNDDFFIASEFDNAGCDTEPNQTFFFQGFWAVRISYLNY